jgi:ComF family protein
MKAALSWGFHFGLGIGRISRVDNERGKPVSVWAKQIAKVSLQSLNHLLWPAVCLNCGIGICEGDRSLCTNCWDEILGCTAGDYCPRCGKEIKAGKFGLVGGVCPGCPDKEFYFDRIARAGVYEKALRNMILSFKHGQTELDSVLGFLANSTLCGSVFYDRIELLVPVPLHWSRRLVRGYNQSLVITKKLKHPTAKISTNLVRIRRTQSQFVVASRAARARNVAGAFAVCDGHDFAGRTVCLVDDIKTTGATLNECARILKQAGASKVFALVLAVAGQDTT